MNEENFVNVPKYIEKLVKKLFKTEEKRKELVEQIYDFMELSGIPKNTPLCMLKNFPQEEVDPNQTRLNFEEENLN